ncbi:LytR/AlgR family response regulator transcription factor [Sediminitomix flava]|uniref:LytTR family two component transcriptional regulator n=1 Tax=Sediminitomix flava TaxID=379075 RepID=A0A315ZCF7_SEDFL|nr:LytTR family DNA-binding domain-containing protein [Sediminitomix flava]PWJ43265.1 LytTR family two component transcriptional regulator [Sediminitomix flava]
MKLRAIIVDDEPLAIDVLKAFTEQIDTLDIKGEFTNPMEAMSYLQNNKVDLIFLDINMPVLNGLDFVKAQEQPPLVIFTTAHREYALEGFELDVCDYLLKPISFHRFLKAVNKAISRKSPAQASSASVSSNSSKNEDEYIFMKVDKKMVKVYFNDILYIESLKDYIKVCTKGGEKLIVHQTLTSITEQLPSADFMRVHRSYTVSFKHIESIEGNFCEIEEKEIPISRLYQTEFRQRVNKKILSN